MNRLQELKEKYGDLVKHPEKKTEDVINYLISKVDFIPQKNDFMGNIFQKILIKNITSCILNKTLKLEENDLDIQIVTIIENKKSKEYYLKMDDKEQIYVIFEKNTGYIESNCNLLFLELSIERGIQVDDYNSENDFCKAYLSYLECYSENRI